MNKYSVVQKIPVNNPKIFEKFSDNSFLVSDLTNIWMKNILTKIPDNPNQAELQYIKISPNNNIYYFYLSTDGKKNLSYTVDFKKYIYIVKSNGSAVSFNDHFTVCVGNNIIIASIDVLYFNQFSDYFSEVRLNLPNPLAVFQLVPLEIGLVGISSDEINSGGILTLQTLSVTNLINQAIILEVFRTTINAGSQVPADYSVDYEIKNGSQMMVISYLDSGKTKVLYMVDNEQTFIPMEFNVVRALLVAGQVNILTDKICQ